MLSHPSIVMSNIINNSFKELGQLYCRAVVPSEDEESLRIQNYSPWFLLHASQEMLEDCVINTFYKQYNARSPNMDGESHTANFFEYLVSRCGYIVLNSGPGGICWLEN